MHNNALKVVLGFCLFSFFLIFSSVSFAQLTPRLPEAHIAPEPEGGRWTWVSGSNLINQGGTYGTKGVAAAGNIPGARHSSISWRDSNGVFWLFGGYGYDSAGALGSLNDLWKFDGTTWTWVSGANTINQVGTYGTKGTASSANKPGARYGSVAWIDSSNNLWLFGGNGYPSNSSGVGIRNDLWKFDGINWTWISGANSVGQYGTYGTKGVSSSTTVPGARLFAVSGYDTTGAFLLFGGNGRAASTSSGHLNDLWRFDGARWTWISGSNVSGQSGNFGIKGVASSSNIPTAREFAASWTNNNGDFFIWGGDGPSWTYTTGAVLVDYKLNDLWRFQSNNWTWIAGTNQGNTTGVYGTLGVPDPANTPGGRVDASSWYGSDGSLWLFGGAYSWTMTSWNLHNDLWKFDGTNWTWISGSNGFSQVADYGTQGVAANSNTPGARHWGPVTWTDSDGNLWMFGGWGYNNSTTPGFLNDLWKYEPH